MGASIFQFKHCTIISMDVEAEKEVLIISIQALYDYKNEALVLYLLHPLISIQALYDYKKRL